MSTPPAAHPRHGSPLRLGILLLILATCIAALAYDFKVAKPGAEAAAAKIENFMEVRNQMSVAKGGPVTSADIQKEIGRKPTYVENEPTYTVEWYCWWGKTPLLSTRRHYVTVLYVGEERRFSTQQLNGPPAEDDLPTHFAGEKLLREVPPLAPPGNATPPSVGLAPAGMAPGMGTGPGPGMGGKGKGKGKGKRGGGEPSSAPGLERLTPGAGGEPTPAVADPGTDQPTPEKPAEPAKEKSATEKPADEKPADEKPADEKPAAEKPAEEKPAENKPAEEKPAAEKPIEEKPAAASPEEDKPTN